MKRLDEDGADALVQVRTPVNKFPDFVRYSVQRLQTLCPTLGKKKLSEVLARAGLHLATTTIGRIRKEKPKPGPLADRQLRKTSGRVVTAKRPNHVRHVDITVIPTQMGFWCPWLPFALPQAWPWCWWLAVAVDHHSRRALGFALFRSAPTSIQLRRFLGRTIPGAGTAPRHLISDKGRQFFPSKGYRRWCGQHDIRPRFGAIGQHGSIAVVERFIRTLKEALRFTTVTRAGARCAPTSPGGSTGTTSIGRISACRDAHRTKSTSGVFRRTVARESSRARTGRGHLAVPGRRSSWPANQVIGSTSSSSGSTGKYICRSSGLRRAA